jgi:hypothetical protein
VPTAAAAAAAAAAVVVSFSIFGIICMLLLAPRRRRRCRELLNLGNQRVGRLARPEARHRLAEASTRNLVKFHMMVPLNVCALRKSLCP